MPRQRGSLEDVVLALASQCDGARMRDGRGFSRADAQEGARLSAMVAAGIPWSASDTKRAIEMAARHPSQAAALLSGGNERLEKALATALRQGRLPALNVVEDSEQPPYSFAALSPGGRNVWFWKMSWIGDLPGFLSGLRAVSRLKHGERRIGIVHRKDAEATVNGRRRKMERWEVPFNGTTLPRVVELAGKHGFALDPAVKDGPDPVVDRLRRSSRACWLREEGRGKARKTVAVFDLERADKDFSETVKKEFRGKFTCSPSDDWNWAIDWTDETKAGVRAVADRFGFSADPAMKA